MLTEALRAFVMHAAWEMDQKRYSAPNIVLVMNFATDVIQRVTALNLGIHATAGHEMSTFADKLVRDSMIWSHLAGDTTQRLKAVKRLLK
jgi:alkylation response protein AidB-like acyl-CoA dehydrogenase